jgi:hypothetical protein
VSWPTVIVTVLLLIQTLARLERLERAANLIPGRNLA